MPAPDGPQFKKLFHGTNVDLEVGSVVEPRNYPRYKEPTAFATPSLASAKGFAAFKARPDSGYVYQVAPFEDDTTLWEGQMHNSRAGAVEVTSNRGFKVVKRVHPK